MQTRILGRTGIEVGVLGLGTEYLVGREQADYDACIRVAADRGVNYVDVLFSYAEYRDRLGKAMQGLQDRFIITGHIGCAETDGQYRRTRDTTECSDIFHDLLTRLDMQRVHVVMIQFVDTQTDYERVMGPGGLYELAEDLRAQGKAQHIGISLHDYTSAQRAAASNQFDVIMFPLGIILAPVPTETFLDSCRQNDVGVVAMKPYGGGRLFHSADTLDIDPCRLVGFPLIKPEVSAVVAGVKNADELESAIRGMEEAPDASEMRSHAEKLQMATRGDCVYCNHCLPCPERINIGELLMSYDAARQQGVDGDLRKNYDAREVTASACTQCGLCESRCPFGVPVMERMKAATALFGR